MDHITIRTNPTNTQVRADCHKCGEWATIQPFLEGKNPSELPPIDVVRADVETAAQEHAAECTGQWA